MAKPFEDTVHKLVFVFAKNTYELVFSIYKVPRGDFWEKQLDQDDDGSEAEADEGLQEAPGAQIHL